MITKVTGVPKIILPLSKMFSAGAARDGPASRTKKRARNSFRAPSGLYPPPGTRQTVLPCDGIGFTRRECNWWWSTCSRLAAQRAIRDRAIVAVPRTAWLQGGCPGHKGSIQRAPTIDSGGEELIPAVSRTSGYCVRNVVIQQASVSWYGRARSGLPEMLQLNCEPNVRIRAVVRDFSRDNSPNRRRRGGLISRYPRP